MTPGSRWAIELGRGVKGRDRVPWVAATHCSQDRVVQVGRTPRQAQAQMWGSGAVWLCPRVQQEVGEEAEHGV